MSYAGKDFTSLLDVDDAFLRHIALGHRNHIAASIYCKGNRLRIQYITITGFHFNQFIGAPWQFVRQHQGTAVIGIERGNGHRRRIVNRLGNQFPRRQISNLETNTSSRDDFSRLSIMFFHPDKAAHRLVIENIAVSLAMSADIYGKIRNKGLPVHALHLMYPIRAVGEVLGNGNAICIGHQQIALTLFGCVIAARAGEVNLEDCAFLRLLNDAFSTRGFYISWIYRFRRQIILGFRFSLRCILRFRSFDSFYICIGRECVLQIL